MAPEAVNKPALVFKAFNNHEEALAAFSDFHSNLKIQLWDDCIHTAGGWEKLTALVAACDSLYSLRDKTSAAVNAATPGNLLRVLKLSRTWAAFEAKSVIEALPVAVKKEFGIEIEQGDDTSFVIQAKREIGELDPATKAILGIEARLDYQGTPKALVSQGSAIAIVFKTPANTWFSYPQVAPRARFDTGEYATNTGHTVRVDYEAFNLYFKKAGYEALAKKYLEKVDYKAVIDQYLKEADDEALFNKDLEVGYKAPVDQYLKEADHEALANQCVKEVALPKKYLEKVDYKALINQYLKEVNHEALVNKYLEEVGYKALIDQSQEWFRTISFIKSVSGGSIDVVSIDKLVGQPFGPVPGEFVISSGVRLASDFGEALLRTAFDHLRGIDPEKFAAGIGHTAKDHHGTAKISGVFHKWHYAEAVPLQMTTGACAVF